MPLRPDIRFRLFRSVFFTVLWAAVLIVVEAPTYAEELALFELPKDFHRSLLHSEVLKGHSNAPAAGRERVLHVPLHSGRPPVALMIREATRREVTVRILSDSGRITETVSFPVMEITDFGSLDGVLVVSSRGVWGVLSDRSVADPVYWEITPQGGTANGGIEHRVSSIRASELPHGMSYEGDMRHIHSSAMEGARESESPQGTSSLQTAAASVRVIQLAVVSPSAFTASRRESDVAAHVLAIVSGANAYFMPIGLELDLVGVQVISSNRSDPYSAAQGSQDALEMLTVLQREWRRVTSPVHDIAAVLGKGFFGGVLGIAYYRTSCVYPEYARLFTTLLENSNAAAVAVAATLAHEIGHVVGMAHDPNLYSGRASLMYPYYTPNTDGFSTLSESEYLNWAGLGRAGGACLHAESAGGGGGNGGGGSGDGSGDGSGGGAGGGSDDGSGGGSGGGGRGGSGGGSGGGSSGGAIGDGPLTFVGGPDQRIEVFEGEAVGYQVRLSENPGVVSFSVSGIPDGASFDTETGVFQYFPGYNVASVKQRTSMLRLLVTATSGNRSGVLTLRIVVKDTNRPPVFTEPVGEVITVHRGERTNFVVSADDVDEFDRATVTLLSLERVTKRLGGKFSVRERGSTVRIRWKVPMSASGDYRLRFRAVDTAKKQSVKTVTLRIEG